MTHLSTIKSLAPFQPLNDDFVTNILAEITFSIGDRILLRNLENQELTVLRNVVLKHFAEKDHWKKSELKQALQKFIQDNEADVADKDINKIIQQITVPYGKDMI